jgi:hypothetical protein
MFLRRRGRNISLLKVPPLTFLSQPGLIFWVYCSIPNDLMQKYNSLPVLVFNLALYCIVYSVHHQMGVDLRLICCVKTASFLAESVLPTAVEAAQKNTHAVQMSNTSRVRHIQMVTFM